MLCVLCDYASQRTRCVENNLKHNFIYFEKLAFEDVAWDIERVRHKEKSQKSVISGTFEHFER